MLNKLKRTHKNKKSRQVGRGGAKAKTAGRGTKGQNARSGRKKRPELRDFIKRIPKLRGRGKNINTSIQAEYIPVDISVIVKHFPKGGNINPASLVKAGITSHTLGRKPQVKIMGNTPVSGIFIVSECAITSSAKQSILKAGGSIK
jgi:large subunit ribosomal protein L15